MMPNSYTCKCLRHGLESLASDALQKPCSALNPQTLSLQLAGMLAAEPRFAAQTGSDEAAAAHLRGDRDRAKRPVALRAPWLRGALIRLDGGSATCQRAGGTALAAQPPPFLAGGSRGGG
jgi:hypothetical protein